MLHRRRFLQMALAGICLPTARVFASAQQSARLISCRNDQAGSHFASVFDAQGAMLLNERLPGRGHGIAVSPDGRYAVVFGRRPGAFMLPIDLHTLRALQPLNAPAQRHYYGHGVFSPDSALLYATENDYANGRGCIGVYRTDAHWARIAEFPSHGVGPHELKLLRDGNTLAIANGGIRTHPDTPRQKLNLDEMRPNLAYVDRHSGELAERVEPPPQWHQLSIRHIDIGADDRVAIAMQFEGPKSTRPPVVALHRRGTSGPQLLEAPEVIHRRMRNYCGSVGFSSDGSQFAVTAPRGGLATLWSADGTFIEAIEQADVCGVAADTSGLYLTDGLGHLRKLDRGNVATQDKQFADTRWDNHLVMF